jgi:hypothetical protein
MLYYIIFDENAIITNLFPIFSLSLTFFCENKIYEFNVGIMLRYVEKLDLSYCSEKLTGRESFIFLFSFLINFA